MAKGRPTSSSSIEREKRRLEKEASQLQEKEKRIRKVVDSAPIKRAAIQRREKEKRLHVIATTSQHVGTHLHQPHKRRADTQSRVRGTLKKDRRLARIKFLVLCGILALFLIVLWRSMP